MKKLMFWRKAPDAETPERSPSSGSDDTSRTQEELDYQEGQEEEILEARREQDDVAP